MTIFEFIKARHAEDEASLEYWASFGLTAAGKPTVAELPRARAEIAARRRILDIALGLAIHDDGQGDIAQDGEEIARLLAAPYFEHADYDPQWKPPHPWDN